MSPARISVGGRSCSLVSWRSPLTSPVSTGLGRWVSVEKPVSVALGGRSLSEVSTLFSAPKCRSETIT